MGFVNARIFYFIHETGVEDLYIARNFLKDDVFAKCLY